MADSFGKLVVRSYAPKHRALLWSVAGLLTAGVLYATFELGRWDAGFRVVDSVRGALSASTRIRDLEAANAKQRSQLEAGEVARRVDREGYKQVERSLGDMQSQIARLNQDLSFYRGLVQPDSIIHVKVQQMQIVPQTTPGQYRLKFVLLQTGKPDSVVAGHAGITIDGLLKGKPSSLTFAQVTPNRRVGLAYSFRYFQDYDEPVQLPAGFEPTRVGIDIHSGRDKDASHAFRQAFVWKAQGMSVETEAAGNPLKGEVDVQAETTE
ncbi:MAG: hypothetical protein M3N50_13885 [Pseudomonadota bacterium]|nr:hypothetical protein [Pseudomonadota bacterium]